MPLADMRGMLRSVTLTEEPLARLPAEKRAASADWKAG